MEEPVVRFSPINEPMLFSPTPINNIPKFCGSQNKSCIGCSPDPFFPSKYKRKKKRSGYARLLPGLAINYPFSCLVAQPYQNFRLNLEVASYTSGPAFFSVLAM